MRVLLAGEGATELGEWAREVPYRVAPGEKGILEALLDRVEPGASRQVVDGVLWRSIRKYQAGGHASAEERNVLGLALRAHEARCEAIAFCRDRDGDEHREGDVRRGIERARALFGDLRIAGGVARENIEAWILVLLGEGGEVMPPGRTKDTLAERGIRTVREKVAVVEKAADVDGVRERSLRCWLNEARAALRA